MGVSKVNFGNQTLIDLTSDTVTAESLAEGVTAHGADGEPIRGTGTLGGDKFYSIEDTASNSIDNADYIPFYDTSGTQKTKILFSALKAAIDTNTTYTFTDKNATLAWGTKTTVATIGGVDIHVTLPANPNTDHYAWSDITGKPSSFTPASHTHLWADITDKPSTFTPASHTHAWSEITGKPSTFTPAAHSHAWSDITSGIPNTTLAADSGTATINLAANTTYKLTAAGKSVIFKTPADANNDHYPSAYCNTDGATAAKAATCTSYALRDQNWIHVLMKNSNTVQGAITLNINGTGAKTIYINGAASSASNYTLPAGSYLVRYEGGSYLFRTDGKLPAHISGNAANVTGTVAIANGGTGATTRLAAAKALTNENVSTNVEYVVGLTNSWGKFGYVSLADLITKLPNYKRFYSSWVYNIKIVSSTGSGQTIWLFTQEGFITMGTSGSAIAIGYCNMANASHWTYSKSGLTITLNCTDHIKPFILCSDNAITVTFTDKSTAQSSTLSNQWATAGHTHPCTIAADSGTNALTLAASTKYKLTAGGSSFIFTTPPNTTYSRQTAASGGTTLSLVNTGDMYRWDNNYRAKGDSLNTYYYKKTITTSTSSTVTATFSVTNYTADLALSIFDVYVDNLNAKYTDIASSGSKVAVTFAKTSSAFSVEVTLIQIVTMP